MIPEVRYSKTSDDVHIAYQVVGEGPIDLVYVPGFASNLLWQWQFPAHAQCLTALASFSRLIVLDRRGTGLSDRFSTDDLPPLEALAEDLTLVLDDAGSEQAAFFSSEDGGLTCALFAATHPERTRALVLDSLSPSPEVGGWTEETWNEYLAHVGRDWGTRAFALEDLRGAAPSRADDLQCQDWYVAYLQSAASPAAAEALPRIWRDTDIRPVLPSVRTPTLVVHRADDEWTQRGSRVVAALIRGARLVEPPGRDTLWWAGDVELLIGEIQEFLTGTRPAPAPDRVLATVLFTDIVDSTGQAAQLGDARWKELLGRHHAVVRAELQRFRGREIDTAGDRFLATFDGPARAARCAKAIADAVRLLGMEIRAGVHTGEVELEGDDLTGIAVHIGARVSAIAGPGEVLVSSTVKDLVAGRVQISALCSSGLASRSRMPASTS